MNLQIGSVVISKAGRDKGRHLAVIEILNNRVMIADGKERKLEKPKSKNIKHIQFTKMMIDTDLLTKNNALRKHLNTLNRKDETLCQKPI